MSKKMIRVSDMADPSTIQEIDVVSEGNDTVRTADGETYYSAYCFPISMKEKVEFVVKERAKLKKAFDDSMSWIYELLNEKANNK